mmetsp:Transcript_10941/g.20662  ORF Transcript_10941/g.20662 Transcript_10941/m.20662 type:complete len:97 (+) Transcript_10941:532-822(+)
MRGGGNLAAILVQTTVVDELQNAQLVTAGQMQLKRLGQIGDFPLFFRQCHGQTEVVPGKLVADEMNLFPDKFQELHALLGCQEEVIQLDNGMVELP